MGEETGEKFLELSPSLRQSKHQRRGKILLRRTPVVVLELVMIVDVPDVTVETVEAELSTEVEEPAEP